MIRRLFFYVDWLLLAAVLVLTAIGLAMIYSTTFDVLHGRVGPQFHTQLYAVVIGLAALAVCLVFDYRRLSGTDCCSTASSSWCSSMCCSSASSRAALAGGLTSAR